MSQCKVDCISSQTESQLYFLPAARLVNCSFLISEKKNKQGWRYRAWLMFLQQRQKKSFLPILRVRAAAAVAAAAPRGAEQMFFFCGTSTSCLGCLRRYSALPSYWELSVIISKKCSIWLISSCVQPFLFLPFTWEMTPSMLASHIQYVAVYDKLIYKQFIDTQRRKMFVFLQFNLVCSCVKDICVRWWSLRSGTPTLIVSPTWGFDAVHVVAHFLLSARNKTEAFLENWKRSILVKYLSVVIMRFFFLLSVSICGRRNSFCTFGWRVMLSVCLSYKYLMAEHINN